jgi:RNA polymerase sigma-70 factor, ECF subfamily
VRQEDERRDAFRRLTRQRLERAYALASLLLRNREDAEDAVHDAVVRAWSGFGHLRDRDRFDPWFDRIVVNCCREQLRRRTRIRPMVWGDEEGSDQWTRTAQREAIRECLADMTVEHRFVIVLRFFADMSIHDIAVRCGARDGTVRSRLHYALRSLRAAYDAAERG